MKKPDMRDISIIDAMPIYRCDRFVLDVGCGNGRIDYILDSMGYVVSATDYKMNDSWKESDGLKFYKSNIFNLDTFPIQSSPIVICSEVLEHLEDYKVALANLLVLTQTRLIITVPFKISFDNTATPPEGHCNHWDDSQNVFFKDINEFRSLCQPYSVSISKIRTKHKDVAMQQWAYLIVVDKRQRYG